MATSLVTASPRLARPGDEISYAGRIRRVEAVHVDTETWEAEVLFADGRSKRYAADDEVEIRSWVPNRWVWVG